jgi:ribosome-binding protein aMBF1 (putative translation factor)
MTKQKNRRTPATKSHEKMIAEWMQDAAFKDEYNALEEEYQLLREMLQARKRAGLTQLDVAERMGTKAPAVARLERMNIRDRHSPSMNTLRKYAHAVGCKLEIHLKPFSKKDLKVKHTGV